MSTPPPPPPPPPPGKVLGRPRAPAATTSTAPTIANNKVALITNDGRMFWLPKAETASRSSTAPRVRTNAQALQRLGALKQGLSALLAGNVLRTKKIETEVKIYLQNLSQQSGAVVQQTELHARQPIPQFLKFIRNKFATAILANKVRPTVNRQALVLTDEAHDVNAIILAVGNALGVPENTTRSILFALPTATTNTLPALDVINSLLHNS